eukprot:13880603-Alexandrium_andersonii.AAC.1
MSDADIWTPRTSGLWIQTLLLRSLSLWASAERDWAGRRTATTSPGQSWTWDWSSQLAPKRSGSSSPGTYGTSGRSPSASPAP